MHLNVASNNNKKQQKSLVTINANISNLMNATFESVFALMCVCVCVCATYLVQNVTLGKAFNLYLTNDASSAVG